MAKIGLRVFPLRAGTKTPALKAWQDVATCDLDVIQEWWTGEFHGCGVGVATGAESGVWVLDIDAKNGVNGFETLAGLCKEHGEGRPLPQTLTIATPSGGAHLYFQWSEGVPNSTGTNNALGPGLDVRGRGGYVRAPGWDGLQVVPREGVRSVKVVAAPGWLVDLTRKRKERPVSSEGEPDGGMHVMGTHRTLVALKSAPHGGRNTALHLAAVRLGLRGELSKANAWRSCAGILVDMGAGDGMDAWRRTFESGWRWGQAKRDASMNTQTPSAAGSSAPTEG
jgi:hypothetical protein